MKQSKKEAKIEKNARKLFSNLSKINNDKAMERESLLKNKIK